MEGDTSCGRPYRTLSDNRIIAFTVASRITGTVSVNPVCYIVRDVSSDVSRTVATTPCVQGLAKSCLPQSSCLTCRHTLTSDLKGPCAFRDLDWRTASPDEPESQMSNLAVPHLSLVEGVAEGSVQRLRRRTLRRKQGRAEHGTKRILLEVRMLIPSITCRSCVRPESLVKRKSILE